MPHAELPVKRCSITEFSHGGALFAAVGRSNAILVYETYGAGPPAGAAYAAAAATGSPFGAAGGGAAWPPARQLRGHVSTVTGVAWSSDDRHLVSCGAGGAVYVWDAAAGTRLSGLEYVDKSCVYSAGGVWSG